MSDIRYAVPPEWYEGVYHDGKSPCNAGRSFSLVHPVPSGRAVLLVHGYAGYPGELVRPARDLYAAGFDVFVPRLPGCGTCADDFIRSRRRDWVGVVRNALRDLKGKYGDVSLGGHSMGASVSIAAAAAEPVRSMVLAAPAIAYPGMKPPKPLWEIYACSLLRKRIPTPWHHQSEYVMYYENAPADDDYLGGQYWSWVYFRQLYELYTLMQEAEKALAGMDVPILAISGGKDQIMGEKPALHIMETGRGERQHLHIPECTHFLYYDPDKNAEDRAVKATVDWLSGSF